jgi:hypothetical protein
MSPAPGLHASGFFVLRTPLLPFDELLAWSQDDVDAAGSLDAYKDLLRARLKHSLARPEVGESLFLASPRLATGLKAWFEGSEDRLDLKLERALVRYFSRMVARPTPFGLFGGCSTGAVASTSAMHIGPRSEYQRHTRLDMEYLSSLVADMERDPETRRSLTYRPNSSIYRSGGRLRYAEARTTAGVRSHHLVAVEEPPYLTATLQRSEQGARMTDIASKLVDDEITREEAEDYVGELIDSQILVSDLAPPITGDEPIHALISALEQHSSTAKVAGMLDEVRAALDEIDRDGLGSTPDRYLDVAGSLERLPPTVELSRLFQVDMIKPAEGLVLAPDVIDEIRDAVQILHRVSGRTYGDDALVRFQTAFTERYGDREVPLLEALDEEVGVGFEASRAPSAEASPLLAGLVWPSPPDDRAVWGRRSDVLLRKLLDAVANEREEIERCRSCLHRFRARSRPV